MHEATKFDDDEDERIGGDDDDSDEDDVADPRPSPVGRHPPPPTTTTTLSSRRRVVVVCPATATTGAVGGDMSTSTYSSFCGGCDRLRPRRRDVGDDTDDDDPTTAAAASPVAVDDDVGGGGATGIDGGIREAGAAPTTDDDVVTDDELSSLSCMNDDDCDVFEVDEVLVGNIAGMLAERRLPTNGGGDDDTDDDDPETNVSRCQYDGDGGCFLADRNILSCVDHCQLSIKSEAMLRANSRLWRNSMKLVLLLVFVTIVFERSFLFVGADSIVAIVDAETDAITDKQSIKHVEEENGDDSQKGNIVEPGANFPAERPVSWPASLVRAAQVGAKLGDIPKRQTEKITDVERQESEMNSPNTNNVDGAPHNTKMMTGCHWGKMGCKKVQLNDGEMNSSSAEYYADTGLANSATAMIEARVLKGRGPSLRQHRTASTSSVLDVDDAESDRKDSGQEPPQGFRLAGRIVTSPSDGLSYFLDAPQDNPEDRNGDWMMTIPYRYLECGPTIESTTEAFPLTDMVLRHFPHSASMGHWTNLGGGVTIEKGLNEGRDGEGTRYIDTDGNNEGHPRLLVALSPLMITVSGNNEESRKFNPGDVILMEDTLGKGHKMNAAPVIHEKAQLSKKSDSHGQDLSVIMVGLPHTVHLPIYDWPEEPYLRESPSSSLPSLLSELPPNHNGADNGAGNGADNVDNDTNDEEEEKVNRDLLGFAPKHLHHKHRLQRKHSSLAPESLKPCPLEYDSAYSSLFIPTHNQYKRLRRSRSHPRKGESQFTKASFDETHPPPPWFSTYEKELIGFRYLPSLRRTMLVGLGLSLTSSVVYCVQLLYPPLLALWGGATMILGGALMNVLVARWSYRRFVADWLEEWRWRREVRRNKTHREELMKEQEVIDDEKDELFVSD